MAYDRDDYYQECFEIAMDEAGCGHLLAQMSSEQKAEVGGAISGAVENVGLAFYTPENPMIERNKTLERQLAWERELWPCEPCKASGRLRYNAGPWAVDTECDKCNGDGKYHPRKEARPS